MLRVVLVFDCERFVSFSQGNPRWNKFEKIKGKINSALKNLRYNESGFELVYSTILKEEIPATFMIVGKLFSPIKSPSFVEWGNHTLNHLPLTLIDDEKLAKEVENKWGLKSFNAPMWMIDDKKDPSRIFRLLKKEGYTHCVYRGENDGIKHFHQNFVKKPFKKDGITCVNVSNFLEGNFRKKRIEKIKRDVLNNLASEGVYLLTSHDFTHKSNRNLLEIISFLKRLERGKKVKLLLLKDIK